MKKRNQSGFMLAEAFIVSTFILGVIVFMFLQIRSIVRSYNRSFTYNTVPGLYTALEIKKYIKNTNYNTLITNYNSNIGYIDLSDPTYLNDFSNSYWASLIRNANIKTIFFADDHMTTLRASKLEIESEKMDDFIKYIKTSNEDDKYRIIIEYNDDTYASVEL